ncbi:MAG: hypothetical protein JWL63_437 [Rhodocyclales bacterium]|nr:hypothetical protein [Rhodocyclales bacterium]
MSCELIKVDDYYAPRFFPIGHALKESINVQ